MKDPIELGPYARSIDHGSWRPTHSSWIRSQGPASWPLQLGAWVLQAAVSQHAPTNSAINSKSTYSLQYPYYSTIHSEFTHGE